MNVMTLQKKRKNRRRLPNYDDIPIFKNISAVDNQWDHSDSDPKHKDGLIAPNLLRKQTTLIQKISGSKLFQ